MKRALYRGLVRLGRRLHLAEASDWDEPGTLRVLMYHRVAPEAAALVVSPESFARQQELLASDYRVVSLEQVLTAVRGGGELPARAVLLTFDDGYRDNLEVAKPILDRYGHPATVFVPTDFVGFPRPLPHDVRRAQAPPTLTWDELRELSLTFTVGSHGCSHRILTSMTLRDAQHELSESKRRLERELGTAVAAFSYPKGSIGDFSRELQRAAVNTGYELVFTTLPGINRPPLNPHRLKRHNVEDFGLDYFSALLDGSAELLAVKDSRSGYWAKRTVALLRR